MRMKDGCYVDIAAEGLVVICPGPFIPFIKFNFVNERMMIFEIIKKNMKRVFFPVKNERNKIITVTVNLIII